MNSVIRHLISKDIIFWLVYYSLCSTPLKRLLSDATFLKVQYRCLMGKSLNLSNPQDYNEKLQWLKIHDHNPIYTRMVDKYEAKKYVAEIIGKEYVIPALGVWDRAEDIEWDKLPNSFVLKCTHDSGGLIVCKDKSQLDKASAVKKINNCLKCDYYLKSREWPYKNVRPRVLAEELLESSENRFGNLLDYKFFCFNGIPKVMYISDDLSHDKSYTDFFDMEFNHLPLVFKDPNAPICPSKPECFEIMKDIASKLSKDLPHVRVDFYYVNGHIYFGELTFFHNSGLIPVQPYEWGLKLGDWIKLPLVNTNENK